MNTQKNVNQRLAKLYTKEVEGKQELSAEKVELATMKDITKWLTIFEKDLKAARSYKSDYNMRITQAKKEAIFSIEKWIKAEPAINGGSVAEGHIKDVIAAGRDLGVDMAKNNDVQRLQNRIDEIKEMNSDIAKMKKDAESEIKKLR